MEQKKLSDAEKLFKKSISLSPSFVNPYMGKAMTEGIQGKTEDAKKLLKIFLPTQMPWTPARFPYLIKPVTFIGKQ